MIKASLFVTCLVDQFFPEVGESVVKVLRRQGVTLDFPSGQTCCGQVAFNTGYRKEARAIARRVVETFRDSEYVVVPSGSCASMMRVFYHELFEDDPALASSADALAGRVYEFSEFLVKVLGISDLGVRAGGRISYHSSCHLLRELGVSEEPLRLLEGIEGGQFVRLRGDVPCCGFGGAFSVKMPEISEAMLEEKLKEIAEAAPDVLTSCDMGCLMHIGGAMARRSPNLKVLHLAQVLAGDLD